MKASRRLGAFFLFSAIMFVALASNSFPAEMCTGKNATLDCLRKHSQELYNQNFELFWDIFNKAADKANKCDDTKSTAEFLKVVQIPSDGEIAEGFSENVENLCVSNTKCFLDALLLLDTFDQDRIIYELYIPTFKQSEEITEALGKYKANEKYKRVINLYMKKFKTTDNQ